MAMYQRSHVTGQRSWLIGMQVDIKLAATNGTGATAVNVGADGSADANTNIGADADVNTGATASMVYQISLTSKHLSDYEFAIFHYLIIDLK